MTTIGDNLLVFGGFALSAITLWALILLSSLLFRVKVAVASREAEAHPWRALTVGMLVGLPAMIVLVILANVPHPIVKILALVGALALLALSAVGGAGIARLIGERVRQAGGAQTSFGATATGSALMVGAMLVPLVGWLFIAPAMLFMGLGLTTHAAIGRRLPAPAPGSEAV